MSEFDPVNRPAHYCQGKIECIDMMQILFGKPALMWFCRLNAFKYIVRAPFKGNPEQDQAKADWYLSKAGELSATRPYKVPDETRKRWLAKELHTMAQTMERRAKKIEKEIQEGQA